MTISLVSPPAYATLNEIHVCIFGSLSRTHWKDSMNRRVTRSVSAASWQMLPFRSSHGIDAYKFSPELLVWCKQSQTFSLQKERRGCVRFSEIQLEWRHYSRGQQVRIRRHINDITEDKIALQVVPPNITAFGVFSLLERLWKKRKLTEPHKQVWRNTWRRQQSASTRTLIAFAIEPVANSVQPEGSMQTHTYRQFSLSEDAK